MMINIMAALILVACQAKKKDTTMAVVHSDTVYTCSMHPQVTQERPGKCPICGMELIPVKKSLGRGEDGVQLSDQQVQLGGIRVDTVGGGAMGDRMVLTGTVTVDETVSSAVSARLGGRIERLYVKTTGEFVHKGQKLYDLYSEELNNAEQEYLLALERQETLHSNVVDLKQLAEAAREKLKLWGLSDAQVAELARVRRVQGVTSFYSPGEGVVASVESHEGDYVGAGTVVLRLTDLSSVWVEAQVYASQLSELSAAAPVTVSLPDVPGREWPGRISFVNPEVDPATQIDAVRISLRNRDGALKPGMAAEVTVTSNGHHALTLPETAVLRDARGSVVWVVAGHNLFRPVMVQTGVETGGRVEIRSGLKAGDVVVTEGAYLVNSEYGLKHGGDAMAGMKM
ncbi:MAG TPA: efflux RND transporter periplasmic adaptor subunit [Puia sp.]|nr:efflux RND transporter periplasmic adaptor subunit [Puia sp.]